MYEHISTSMSLILIMSLKCVCILKCNLFATIRVQRIIWKIILQCKLFGRQLSKMSQSLESIVKIVNFHSFSLKRIDK